MLQTSLLVMKSLNKTVTPIFYSIVCPLFPKAIILTFISSLGASPGQLMPWPVVRRPSLAFLIFNISITISWKWLKLSGRHCGNMEIQNY